MSTIKADDLGGGQSFSPLPSPHGSMSLAQAVVASLVTWHTVWAAFTSTWVLSDHAFVYNTLTPTSRPSSLPSSRFTYDLPYILLATTHTPSAQHIQMELTILLSGLPLIIASNLLTHNDTKEKP